MVFTNSGNYVSFFMQSDIWKMENIWGILCNFKSKIAFFIVYEMYQNKQETKYWNLENYFFLSIFLRKRKSARKPFIFFDY